MARSSTITPLLPHSLPNYISGCLPLASKCALRGIRCPTDHALIERTHQTMTAQALLGQTYSSHADLWAGLDERREVLNEHSPTKLLWKPIRVPSTRGACIEPPWEEDLLRLENVWSYL